MREFSRRRVLALSASCATVATMGVAMTAPAADAVLYDFTLPLEGWESVSGRWQIERMGDAASGLALVQRATGNAFNVILAPAGPFGDVEVSVGFKPMAGREDASGGIVFRFDAGRYYVIRANALEDNFNFYYYDQGRRQIAGTSVKAPAIGVWHTLRITAEGDRMRGWLDDRHLLDVKDARYASGRVGLWTKADSVTAFDSLLIAPIRHSGVGRRT